MTYREAINTFQALAQAKGLEAVDKSDDDVLRIEYRKNGQCVGGASYIGCTAHPEWIRPSDWKAAEWQITGLATKKI